MRFIEFLKEEEERTPPETSGRYFTVSELKSWGRRPAIAKKLGLTVKELSDMSDEELAVAIRDIGEHDFVPDSEFDPEELRKGIEVEKEHTRSILLAKLIAKDHLSEPGAEKYYTNLEKMEKRMKYAQD